MREVVLGRHREPAFARRAEERAARADDDDSAAEQQPAQVLGERRRGAEQPAVPRLRRSTCRPSTPCARRSATSSSTSSTCSPPAHGRRRLRRPPRPRGAREQGQQRQRGALINAANKLKYWDLFKDLYQVVSQRQPGQFPHQFIEELARAYELEESRARLPAALPGRRSSASRHPPERDSRIHLQRQKGRPLRTVRSIAGWSALAPWD